MVTSDWIGSDLNREEFNEELDEEKEVNSFCFRSEMRKSMDNKIIREQLTNLFNRFFDKINNDRQTNTREKE